MAGNPRPIAVTLLAGLYIAIGAAGLVAHFHGLTRSDLFRFDGLGIELLELAALVCGIFLLRGQNWARWLALAWISFHVVLSVFNGPGEVAIHALFCAVIAWFLFRGDAARYFRAPRTA